MEMGDRVWSGRFNGAYDAEVTFVQGDLDEGGHSYKLNLRVASGEMIVTDEVISLYGAPLFDSARLDSLIEQWRGLVANRVNTFLSWRSETRFDKAVDSES